MKPSSRQFFGRVLWWDDVYGRGIVVSSGDRQYYFDSSVVDLKPDRLILDDFPAMFRINESIETVPCACDVKIFEKGKVAGIKKGIKYKHTNTQSEFEL